MPKLTGIQSQILSSAAARTGLNVLPLPKSIKVGGGALTKALKDLLKRRLVAEVGTNNEASTWHVAKGGKKFGLVVSDVGLKAIGRATGEDKTNSADDPSPNRKPAPQRKNKTAAKHTKQDLVLELLRRKEGATVSEIAKATGWQDHSVRGVISGSLKKKLGLAVQSTKVEGRGRVYRIAANG